MSSAKGLQEYSVCAGPGCYKSGDALKVCGQCKTIFYCGSECQKKDWKRHKPHCHRIDKNWIVLLSDACTVPHSFGMFMCYFICMVQKKQLKTNKNNKMYISNFTKKEIEEWIDYLKTQRTADVKDEDIENCLAIGMKIMSKSTEINKLPREQAKRYIEASSAIRKKVKDHNLITIKLTVDGVWTIFSMGFDPPEGTEKYMDPLVDDYLKILKSK
jgi:hypothetical protein